MTGGKLRDTDSGSDPNLINSGDGALRSILVWRRVFKGWRQSRRFPPDQTQESAQIWQRGSSMKIVSSPDETPRRSLALSHAKGAAQVPAASPAHQGKTTVNHELRTGQKSGGNVTGPRPRRIIRLALRQDIAQPDQSNRGFSTASKAHAGEFGGCRCSSVRAAVRSSLARPLRRESTRW